MKIDNYKRPASVFLSFFLLVTIFVTIPVTVRAKKSDSKLVAIACSCNIITRINILVEIFEKVKVKIIFYGNGKVMEFVERV